MGLANIQDSNYIDLEVNQVQDNMGLVISLVQDYMGLTNMRDARYIDMTVRYV